MLYNSTQNAAEVVSAAQAIARVFLRMADFLCHRNFLNIPQKHLMSF